MNEGFKAGDRVAGEREDMGQHDGAGRHNKRRLAALHHAVRLDAFESSGSSRVAS